jgi:ribosomal protein L40E
MTYCRNCGAELKEDAKFCSKCGTPVSLQTVKTGERPKRKSLSPLAIASIAGLATVGIIILVTFAFLMGGLPFGGVIGSGNLQTRQESFTGFDTLDVGSGFKVQVTQANSYRILITADDNVLNYTQVTKTGNTLSIRLQPWLSFQTTTLRAEIWMPALKELQFSGGVNGTARDFVLTHDFTVGLSGGSVLRMEGEARDLEAVCSGGSRLDLSDFGVGNAQIDFSGGSQGTVDVTGRLDASLSGGSKLTYIGNPTLGTISTSGGSTISPG